MTSAQSKFRPLGLFNVTLVSGALLVTLATRPLPEAHAEAAPTGETEASSEESAPVDAQASETAATPTPTEVNPPTPTPAAADAAPPEPEQPAEPERTLRVVGLGWELLAPGVIANDGLAPGDASEFRDAGLAVEFSVALSADELATRLARGGGVEDGADVALLPLPTFVASYEQLRALSPEVFFVVGWSRGRDALAADDPEFLTRPAPRGSIELVGAPGQAATMLSLFALDEIGVDASRVQLVNPLEDPEKAKDAKLRAVERSLISPMSALAGPLDHRELALTSADAPGLLPMVAVAPARFIDAHPDELARFGRTWLLGSERFSADVPAGARRIAKERGAPEAVALLEMIGYVQFADLADSARLAGLSGRGAVSLELLFHRSWELWREVGVLSTPAPEHAPLDNAVIARVALGEGAPVVTRLEQPRRAGERLILVHRIPAGASLDEASLVAELGFLAGSFDRAEIELRIQKDKRASQRVVKEAIERFDLDPEHVRVGPRIRGAEAVQISVFVP